MLHEILVHVDASLGSVDRADAARAFAAQYGAACRVFTVLAAPMAAYGAGSSQLREAYGVVLQKAKDEAAAVAEETKSRFALDVETLSTLSSRVQVDAASLMRPYDLIALTAPIGEDQKFVDDDVFEAALFQSGRPVLVLPRAPIGPMGETVAVAWKDCREAARAVHEALPILRRAKAVKLIAVKGEEDERFFGQPALDRMVQALKARGIAATHAVVDADKDGAGATFFRAAKDTGADLVVMGAYGHWRLAERLFGGMTAHAIAQAGLPLFLAH
jgi:nucleotide-binding universal stress UspA family protein